MKKYIYLLIVLQFNFYNSFAQQEVFSFFDKIFNNQKVKKITINNEYLCYSNSRYIYLIINAEDSPQYYEFFFKIINENEICLLTSNIIEDEKLKIFFNQQFYKKGIINLGSDFYYQKDVKETGLPSYLSLVLKDGSKYFEYYLPAAINIFPYSQNIRSLLRQRFNKYISLNNIENFDS